MLLAQVRMLLAQVWLAELGGADVRRISGVALVWIVRKHLGFSLPAGSMPSTREESRKLWERTGRFRSRSDIPTLSGTGYSFVAALAAIAANPSKPMKLPPHGPSWADGSSLSPIPAHAATRIIRLRENAIAGRFLTPESFCILPKDTQ